MKIHACTECRCTKFIYLNPDLFQCGNRSCGRKVQMDNAKIDGQDHLEILDEDDDEE